LAQGGHDPASPGAWRRRHHPGNPQRHRPDGRRSMRHRLGQPAKGDREASAWLPKKKAFRCT
jgi:hypothetical protein